MSKLIKLRSLIFKYSPRLYYRIYFLTKGKILRINNPVYINDLIIHGIIYHSESRKRINLTDKIKVREYVKDKGLSNILVPLVTVYDSVDEIDLDKLPEKSVLKANHGSGFNLILDKSESIDLEAIKTIANNWISKPLPIAFDFEPHYQYIEPKLYAETFIDDFSEDKFPLDYKFFCFYGKPLFCEVVSRYYNDYGQLKFKMDIYDFEWKRLNYVKQEYMIDNEVSEPKNFDLMINYAESLSENLDFARVDLYNVDGKIFFGEITFTPSGGVLSRFTKEMKNKAVLEL